MLVGGLVVATAACSDSKKDKSDADEPASTSQTTAADTTEPTETTEPVDCSVDALNLVNAGVLTVGTASPAEPPWFQDDDPTNGQGFESAVAYAVADELGFDKSEVTWATVAVDDALAPGDKAFDFDINHVSIDDARKQAVDFSESYYETTPAAAGGPADELGLVFAKGNPLRDCVDKALGWLKESGELERIEQQWPPGAINA